MNKITFHPLLFSIYPVLFLYAQNSEQFTFVGALPLLFIVVFLSMLLWGILYLVLKSTYKSSIIISGFVFIFFSYGHIPLPDISRIIVFFLFLILLTLFILNTKKENKNVTKNLNFFSLILIGLTVYQIINNINFNNINYLENTPIKNSDSKVKTEKPDIYYIILDGYGRQDVLKSIYNYNNSNFIDSLQKKGFFIASNSFSNYCHTTLSLASSLNMGYLTGLEPYENISNRLPLMSFIQNNHVSRILKNENYETVAFATGYTYTEINNADRFIKPSGIYSHNEFTYIVLNVTPIPYLLSFIQSPLIESHRSRILFTFKKLAELKRKNKPMFVFSHIMAPHPPFVFGVLPNNYRKTFTYADGTHLINKKGINREKYLELYPQQLEYISNLVLETIDGIIENSDNPPIIIIQSDHGPGSGLDWDNAYKTNYLERFSILNALYLPGFNHEKLNNDLTPVNTFRHILNHYFANTHKIHDNKIYCSNWPRPYKLIEVTDKLYK